MLAALFFISSVSVGESNDGNWYKDQELGVSFYYMGEMVPTETIMPTTKFAVNWLSSPSGHLIASCFLSSDGPIPVAAEKARTDMLLDIDRSSEIWANAMRKKGNVEITEYRPVKIDGIDALYIVANIEQENLEMVTTLKYYTLWTYWRHSRISLNCATSIHKDNLAEMSPQMAEETTKKVEGVIISTLRTLRFHLK
ncbi:hypothetical protein [Roseospira goensis]|uniref:Uncharacterized protein n=1 Tax=Roseospira goensis TaxID=391922 RepID=A0A7W6S341_9PROT|nr:hypothetical protein [Roseospira goensis]MBB4287872.1 hypothetical protein [Roseospira goensis]